MFLHSSLPNLWGSLYRFHSFAWSWLHRCSGEKHGLSTDYKYEVLHWTACHCRAMKGRRTYQKQGWTKKFNDWLKAHSSPPTLDHFLWKCLQTLFDTSLWLQARLSSTYSDWGKVPQGLLKDEGKNTARVNRKSINKIHTIITIRCLSSGQIHYSLCSDQSSWWLFAQVRRGMTTPLFQTYQKSHKIPKTTKVSLRKWLSNFELLWPPGDLTFSISLLEACPLEHRPPSSHNC